MAHRGAWRVVNRVTGVRKNPWGKGPCASQIVVVSESCGGQLPNGRCDDLWITPPHQRVVPEQSKRPTNKTRIALSQEARE